MTGRPVKTSEHLKRLELMPVNQPMTTPQLCKLWGVTNAWPTLEYLLKNGLCKWRKQDKPTIRETFVYYRYAHPKHRSSTFTQEFDEYSDADPGL
jgi:hypothetical protein